MRVIKGGKQVGGRHIHFSQLCTFKVFNDGIVMNDYWIFWKPYIKMAQVYQFMPYPGYRLPSFQGQTDDRYNRYWYQFSLFLGKLLSELYSYMKISIRKAKRIGKNQITWHQCFANLALQRRISFFIKLVELAFI